MVLFVADSHLGRNEPSVERRVEGDLTDCLRSVRGRLSHLFIVGDLFEYYIEYRHLSPKGFVRLLGLLAELSDGGVQITYIAGNHDPWHRDYFESELGIDLVMDVERIELFGKHLHIEHGDAEGGASPFYRMLKPVLRHPVPVWMFRNLLPADLGVSIASWYSRTFQDEQISEERVRAMRDHAIHLLRDPSLDMVVLAHTHRADLFVSENGIYLNPGCWYADRTVGLLDAEGVHLARWNGDELEPHHA